MKPATRVYVDKKLTEQGGGDHSRIIDLAELDPDKARSQAEAMLESDEAINQVVGVSLSDEDPVA